MPAAYVASPRFSGLLPSIRAAIICIIAITEFVDTSCVMLFGAIRALIIGDFVFIEHVVVVIVGIWIGGVYGIRGILNSIRVIGRIAVILFLA